MMKIQTRAGVELVLNLLCISGATLGFVKAATFVAH